MATRYRCFQYPWGFCTIDTQNEDTPPGYIAEFQVNLEEAEMIQDGAIIELNDEGDDVVVYFEAELE